MPSEVELKLALGNDGPALLREHPLLQSLSSTRITLANTYYDTPDDALEKARIALRIRHTPTQVLQTLKTAGHTGAGLSTRGEWEWPIDGSLDIAGLIDLPPMQSLDSTVLEALEPRFSTHFERRIWLIERNDAHIELALDQGEIRSGSRPVAIDELELELKPDGCSDDPATLWQLAAELAEHVPLRPANASKAARGVALLRQRWLVDACDERDNQHGDAQARFERAIDALDAWTDSGDKRFLDLAHAAFEALATDASQGTAIRRHAHALGVSLARPDWLTASFGRHSLALHRALQNA
ncbi:CYTH domain-containing protein [Modicisalibacter muralis]|uniref:CYTH domain-containing protein n=1 Tax=Modicisalibacter muralis TaxID=119000 RepID=A0A1G9JLQ7_9GAMM|nr:CYTH domain-containing protein [Halomonas muralis]SDL38497.1 CYTH domain-containing protein [Halomonas muralis]